MNAIILKSIHSTRSITWDKDSYENVMYFFWFDLVQFYALIELVDGRLTGANPEALSHCADTSNASCGASCEM